MVWDFGIERGFGADTTNNNMNPMVNPFASGANVKHDQWTVAIGVSWALDRK